MSRKWERMVEKNRKQINAQRKKRGQALINEAGKEATQLFQGRSWVLPVLLVVFVVFFVLVPGQSYSNDSLYWWTVVLYGVLALFLFFIRRPFLRIGKTRLTSRRFAGDRSIEAGEVEEIDLGKGYAVIKLKHRHTRWIFSKATQRFDTDKLGTALQEYASRNQIPLKQEAAGK